MSHATRADNVCQRADIFNITVNGGQTTAAFKEYMNVRGGAGVPSSRAGGEP